MNSEAARQHTLTLNVQPGDIDDLGHVNNAVYLRWMEEVARAHADRVGMGVARMRELGVLPVVRRHTITYRLPALPGDELEISTLITSAGGIRATRHNEVRRAGTLLVDCNTDWVWIDPQTGRLRVPPAELFRHFGMES